MNIVTITLRFEENELDLELPSTVPLRRLTPILVEELKWPGLDEPSENNTYRLRSKTSSILIDPNETLEQAGVADGDLLQLIITNKLRQEQLPAHLPQNGDYLVCSATNQVFPIQQRTSFIGRKMHYPINLKDLPDSEWVSRKHANLIRREDGYWIKDIDSRHGTLVDGDRIRSHDDFPLRDGDQIQFGENGPVLILHTEKTER